MALFNNFPWSNFHELNLDWLLKKVSDMEQAFPEGTIGIPKGGTGATTAQEARENLGVYAINIPMHSLDSTTIDEAIQAVADDLDALAATNEFHIYRDVTKLGGVVGTATIQSLWVQMSAGDILICSPDQLYPGQTPETYGTLMLIRSGATSGSCLFIGENHLYRKNFSSNTPQLTWEQLYGDSDVVPVANGGTGADNAADALTNLGIDFSGTVLSVSGVGADPTGNVPLELDDLVVTDISQIGLTPGAHTSAQVYGAMSSGQEAFLAPDQVSDAPEALGLIHMYKDDSTNGLAMFTGANTYTMSLSTGDWTEISASTTPDMANLLLLRDVSATFPASSANTVIVTTDLNPDTGNASPIDLAWSGYSDYKAFAVVGMYRVGSGNTQWNLVSYLVNWNTQKLGYAFRALANVSASNTIYFRIMYIYHP